MEQILELILLSAEGAFLQVTVFVGAVVLTFSYLNYRTKGALIGIIEQKKKWQPIIGSFLGAIPGCGGAILVMPMYIRGTVSFGTTVATLIATFGDAAFVLMTHSVPLFLGMAASTFVVAVVTGYAVDALKLEKKLLKKNATAKATDMSCHMPKSAGEDSYLHGELAEDSTGYEILHKGYWLYYVFLMIGLPLAILLLMQVDVNAIGIPNLGMIVGITGTILSIGLALMRRSFLGDDSLHEEEQKLGSLKETFIHGAQETAFVGMWVFVAFVIYEMVIMTLGGGDHAAGEEIAHSLLQSAGFLSILAAAAVGLIPGCGPQIIIFTLYTQGLMPFSALLANAISQDGDALFPMLAMDWKASFWLTVITTIPGLVIGSIAYLIEQLI